MAFIGVLGTSDSYLGNFVLGSAGEVTSGNVANESLDIDGIAAFTITPNNVVHTTVSIDCNSAATERGGFNLPNSLTVDGIADCTVLPGWRYQQTLTVDSTVDVSGSEGTGLSNTLTISGFSAASCTHTFSNTLIVTLTSIGAVSAATSISYFKTLTITSTGTFTSPGGLVLENSRAIEGFGSVVALPGFAYSNSFSIEAIAATAEAELYLMQLTLAVNGVSNFAVETLYTANASLTVTSIGQAANTSIMSMGSALTLGVSGVLHFENLYSILLDTVGVSALTVTVARFTSGDETPAAAGAFNATCSGIFNRTVTQTLAITQTVGLSKPTQHGTQTLVINQSVTVTKTKNLLVEQTFAMTQEAEASRPIVQTLVIGQTVSVTKVKNLIVTQTLAINQTTSLNTVINRTVAQTLVFYPDLVRTVPIIGSVNGGPVTQFEYHATPATAYLVPRDCLVVLSVASQVIVLPCPQFGDSQAYQGTIDLKRTMTGDTFTYVRKSRLEKVQYSFHVGSHKAYEVKQFLLNHSHELMTMMNWKGETWLVMITNNPVDFVNTGRWQNKGERVEFTLEFEGVKR